MAEMPASIDVDYFKFKQLRKLKINFCDQSFPDDKVASLLAVSNRFGLVFIGTPACKLVFLRTSDLVEMDSNASPAERRTEAVDFPKREIELPGRPSFVSLSADSLTLLVCLEKAGFPVGYLYDVRAFTRQDGAITPFKEIRLSITEGVTVQDCAWNPAVVELVAICLSDGSLTIIGVDGTNVNITSLPAATNARVLSWSPKGKQVVVARDSAIVQYKPDLKEARTIPFNQQLLGMDDSSRPMPCGILWLSTSQFLAAFFDADNPDASPKVFIVNAHKAGPATFINYEDICYEVSKERQRRYLMHILASWNVTLLASSTALEIGALGQSGGTAEHPEWTQWYMEDAWRAELPLNASKEETFPLGVALDMTSQVPIPWGDNQKLDPVPILMILSTSGILCPYHVINLTPGAEKLTHPPEILTASGERKGIDVPQILKKPTVPLAASTPVPGAPTAERPSLPRYNLTESFAAVAQQATVPQFKPTAAPTGFGFAKPAPAPAPAPAAAPAPAPAPAFAPAPAPAPAPVKPIITIPAAPQPAPAAPVAVAPPVLQQQVTAPAAGSSVNESNLLAAVLQGEVSKFQKELQEFKAKAAALRGASAIGSEEDKQKLLKRTADLQSFGKDLVETSRTQNSEVQSLRSETVEMTALIEEARLRHTRRKNPRFHQLLKMRPLDPVSRRRLANIQQLQSYLDQQIQESFQKLEQLTRAQRPTSSLSGNKRLEIPVTQVIYEAVTANEKTINRLCDKLERVKLKAKDQHMKTVGAAWEALRIPRTGDGGQYDSELAALADSLLSTQISKPVANGTEASATSPVKAIIPQVSPEKQALLRDALTNRPVSRVRSVRPETPGESRLLSNLSSLIQAAASPKSKAAEAIPEKPKPQESVSVSPVKPAVKPASSAEVEDITPPSTPINLEQKAKAIGVQPLMSSLALASQQRTPPAPVPASTLSVSALPATTAPSGFSLSFGTSAAKPAVSVLPATTVTSAPVVTTTAPTIRPFSTAPAASIPATSFMPTMSFFGAFSAAAPASTAPPPVPKAAVSIAMTSAAPGPTAVAPSFTGIKLPVATATITPASTGTTSTAATTSAPPAFSFSMPKTASAPALSSMAVPAAAPVSTAPAPSVPAPAFSLSTAKPTPGTPSATSATTTSSFSFSLKSVPATTSAPFSFSLQSTPSAPSAGPSTSATIKPVQLFGQAPVAATTSDASGTTSETKPATPVTTSASSGPLGGLLFGVKTTTSAPAATTAPTSAVSTAVFGQAATPVTSLFGQPTATAPIFGQPPTTTTSTSLFGQPAASTTSATTLFGRPPATTSTSLFGQPATTTTTAAPLFGQAAATTTTSSSLFGQVPATTTASFFGQSTASNSTALFGQAATTTATATLPLFGQTTTSTTSATSAPHFGASVATSAPNGSLFGRPAAGNATPAATSAPSAPLFGQPVTTSAPSAPLFGQPVTTSAPSAPLFGQPITTSAPSAPLFGQPIKTSAPSAPLFGQPIATSAPSASLFGAPTATAAPSGPLFGQSTFGQAPTTSASSFGLFGSAAGSAPAAARASTPTTGGFGTSGMFGGMGLGGTPTAANANRNVFGGGATFGASAPSGLFGSPAPSSGFGGAAAAAAGASSPTPSAFGSFGQSPSQPAFGGAPTFGGSPLFGGRPTFGSGTPTFGSPQTTGNSTPAATGFGGFAAASSMPSFGVLAGSPTGQPAFGGAAFPQTTQPSFGSGSSFSSWR